jgi:hypothetical protein
MDFCLRTHTDTMHIEGYRNSRRHLKTLVVTKYEGYCNCRLISFQKSSSQMGTMTRGHLRLLSIFSKQGLLKKVLWS